MGSKSSGSTSRGSNPIPYRARSLETDKSVYEASNKIRIFFTFFRTVAILLRRTQWNCRKSQHTRINYSRITVLLHRRLCWKLEIGRTCLFHVNGRRKKTVSDKKNIINFKFFLKYMKKKIGGIFFEVFSISNLYLEYARSTSTSADKWAG